MKQIKVVLTTMPVEGESINWTTPPYFDPTKSNPIMPLGILSLASNLPKEIDVKILDPPSYGWSIEKTIGEIEKEQPDVLGLSVTTNRIYAMTEILKRTNTKYKVVGGPHAINYSEIILNQGANAVFVGPLADLEFKEAIQSKQKGIILCKTKINEIKYPKRELLDIEFYFPKKFTLFNSENRMSMFSSLGCPNNCLYCNVQTKKMQFKDSKIVVNEMEYLYSLGSRSFHVLDDNFNIVKKHLIGILSEMEERNLISEWSGRGQTRMDLSLVKRLANTGFKRIHVGFEALDDMILKYFKKKETVKEIKDFCKEMNKCNIDILAYLIIGSPLETKEYLKELPIKIKDLGISMPFFNILFPEPDTEYYNSLIKEKYYQKDYWKEQIKNPVSYFELPYPYGKTKKQEIIDYTNDLANQFKRN